MKEHSPLKTCKTTGKISFPSEAMAMRSVNKYTDIQRCYFCDADGSDHFHLTSESEAVTLGRNILDCEEENKLLKVYNNRLVVEKRQIAGKIKNIEGNRQQLIESHNKKYHTVLNQLNKLFELYKFSNNLNDDQCNSLRQELGMKVKQSILV